MTIIKTEFLSQRGDFMAKKAKVKKRPNMAAGVRINPELRLCSKFDQSSIAKFRVADSAHMGMRVVDDCAEEHIM